jgi:hypothetical protein
MSAGHLVRAIGIAFLLAAGALAQSNAIPLLYQPLLPTTKAPGSKAFTLTVNGTGFATTAVLNWNGAPRLTEVLSSKQVKASISAADVASAQTAWITVTNPAPGGGTSNVVFFPVTRPTASIAMAIRQPFPGATVVEVGDFNNDGKLDVVWMGPQGLNASLGNGNGSFQAPIVTATFSFDALAIGDFNGDGKLDVAGADGSGFVELLLGNGDGTFTEAWQYLPGVGSGNYLAAADFSQSGSLGLYHMGWDLGQQWWGIGGPSFQPGYYTTYFPGPAAIGDFNGDGMLDLAISETSGPADIWLGTASGFQELGTFSGGYPPFGVADMNQDGKLDLVNGCIWLGGGDGTFKAGGCPSGGSGFAGFGDFNGDGKLDTAVDANSGGIMIALGAGDGTYKGGFSFPFPAVEGGGAVGDFNNDGKLDVVTSNGYLLLQTTVDLTPYSLAFGSQNVGTKSATQAATLTNVGTTALAINNIFFTGSAPGQFSQTNDCGLSLAAGSSCTISVTFAPTRAGSLGAALTVSYKGMASPQSVAVSGTGVAPPTVKLLPSSLTFATQLVGTNSTAQTVNLSNPGTLPLAISNIAAHGAFSQTNNCPATLVNASCQIQVVFKPKAAGTAQGSLSVTDNAKGGTQWVNLTGTGTVITVSPAGVNFGSQKVGTKSASAPITLTNVGANAVSITQIAIAGTDAAEFAQSNNCGTSLAGHGNCTINVTFKPTATGARSASVSITDNGGASPQSVALAGTGT